MTVQHGKSDGLDGFFFAVMNLLIREMTFGIWILTVIERRIIPPAKKMIAVVGISFCPQAAVALM